MVVSASLEINERHPMSRLVLLVYLMLSAGSYAATPDPIDPVKLMGFKETTRNRPLIERAAILANDILGSRSGFRLFGSWQSNPSNVDQSKAIRVHLVSPTQNGEDFGIMVPYNCGCVFVQPDIFEKSIARYSNASPQMLKVDDGQTLAFMLLHEIGHIEHGDPGRYEDKQKAHTYNFDQTDQKEIESSADKFAAESLVAAVDDKAHFSGWMASMNVQLALTNISWNLSVIRNLDNFGASVLCSKFVFADDGYTHPNYELRILTVMDLISHTAESRELLASFEACRKEPSQGPLYKKK
jgi:hypothetical protein